MSRSNHRLNSQRGQILVEYVLVLTVSVGIAVLLINTLIKKAGGPEDSGLLIRAWSGLAKTIAEDSAGEVK
ncbi:MAG: hypothetical protein K2X47_13705 [Bdellovibrionales bacterium]|nr:hypothetical protein [Bdellovibrionales bacterium]